MKQVVSQEALDERKELLGLIKRQERDINECEKNIGYFERRIRTVKSHPWYQSEDGTISMRTTTFNKKSRSRDSILDFFSENAQKVQRVLHEFS